MSDDTLSQLVTQAIGANLSPVMKWLYATFATVIVGTAFVVGMVYDVHQGIKEATQSAAQANEAINALKPVVQKHESTLAVLQALMGQKGGG